MRTIHVKPGVLFTVIAASGFRLLAAIDHAARTVDVDLTITSACDGVHSGPADPHHRGEAYDIRTHDLTEPQKDAVLGAIIGACLEPTDPAPGPVDGIARSLASPLFFAFLERPGTADEHIHCQLRNGRQYPPSLKSA